MQINITHQNFDLTEAIKNYAIQKLSLVDRHIKNSEEAVMNVEIGRVSLHHKNGNRYEVKIHLRIGSRNLHIESVHEDAYASIDEARDKLSNEISSSGDRERSIVKKLARRFKNFVKMGN